MQSKYLIYKENFTRVCFKIAEQILTKTGNTKECQYIFVFCVYFLHMCLAEQYRIHTEKVTTKNSREIEIKCNRVTSLDKHLTWVIYIFFLYNVKKKLT